MGLVLNVTQYGLWHEWLDKTVSWELKWQSHTLMWQAWLTLSEDTSDMWIAWMILWMLQTDRIRSIKEWWPDDERNEQRWVKTEIIWSDIELNDLSCGQMCQWLGCIEIHLPWECRSIYLKVILWTHHQNSWGSNAKWDRMKIHWANECKGSMGFALHDAAMNTDCAQADKSHTHLHDWCLYLTKLLPRWRWGMQWMNQEKRWHK